jgi:hypothetical protein
MAATADESSEARLALKRDFAAFLDSDGGAGEYAAKVAALLAAPGGVPPRGARLDVDLQDLAAAAPDLAARLLEAPAECIPPFEEVGAGGRRGDERQGAAGAPPAPAKRRTGARGNRARDLGGEGRARAAATAFPPSRARARAPADPPLPSSRPWTTSRAPPTPKPCPAPPACASPFPGTTGGRGCRPGI